MKEETRHPIRSSDLAPLLVVVPVLALASLSYVASSLYAVGVREFDYYQRNIYGPWLIGALVWGVAAGALVLMFAVDTVLRRKGRQYKMPSVTLVAAGTWNILISGIFLWFSDTFVCNHWSMVSPDRAFTNSLYYAALTFGLLLAGIAAVKFNSIEGRFVTLARWMCLLNGLLALFGLLVMSVSDCLVN